MSSGRKVFFLVGTSPELSHAEKAVAEGFELVAGSQHVFNRLNEKGISAIPAGPLVNAAARQKIVGNVARITTKLDSRLQTWNCPRELRAIAVANVVKAIFRYEGIKSAEAQLGGQIARLGESGLVPARVLPYLRIPYAGRRKTEHPPVARGAAGASYVLDFRSPTGKKLHVDGTLQRFHFKAKTGRWTSVIKNALGSIPVGDRRTRTLRVGFPRLVSTPLRLDELYFDDLENTDLVAVLSGILDQASDAFFAYRSGMRALLRRRGAPQRAVFNHVAHEGIAGCVAALVEGGVPCEMSSHGYMVAYGEGPRHDAARLLDPIYNTFPSMARIAPRSPLQARGASADQVILKTSRLTAFPPELPRSDEFHIYYAPNFQAWHEAYHGLVIDCFQIGRCIQYLTDLVVGLPGFTMGLRIKTTPLDVASVKNVPSIRGFLPVDAENLIRPEAGIVDASWGSHKGYLEESDLVVTEGLTAVMFEALEMRKPVLLLNADATMVPSLPHRPVAELLNGAPRAAVYAASLDDDIAAALPVIRQHHHGFPLSDREVGDYVWV